MAERPASPLTPELLRAQVRGSRISPVWLYVVARNHGCDPDRTGKWFISTAQLTYQELGEVAGKARDTFAQHEADRHALARRAVGPKPAFNSSFTGTRGDFEDQLAERQRVHDQVLSSVPDLDPAQVWASHGLEAVTPGREAVIVNCTDTTARHEHAVQALGYDMGEEECDCFFSHGVIFDPAEPSYDPVKGVQATGASVAAPALLVQLDSGHRWLVRAERLPSAGGSASPAGPAGFLLLTLAQRWRRALDEHAAALDAARVMVQSIPTPGREMTYEQWVQAKKQGGSLHRARLALAHLRATSELDLLASIEADLSLLGLS